MLGPISRYYIVQISAYVLREFFFLGLSASCGDVLGIQRIIRPGIAYPIALSPDGSWSPAARIIVEGDFLPTDDLSLDVSGALPLFHRA